MYDKSILDKYMDGSFTDESFINQVMLRKLRHEVNYQRNVRNEAKLQRATMLLCQHMSQSRSLDSIISDYFKLIKINS